MGSREGRAGRSRSSGGCWVLGASGLCSAARMEAEGREGAGVQVAAGFSGPGSELLKGAVCLRLSAPH